MAPTIQKILEKATAGERLSFADGVTLFDCKDLNALGYLANHVRERKNGNVATYILNLYLNYSNICILSCQFCAFARRPHEKEGQFTYDIEEMARQACVEVVPEFKPLRTGELDRNCLDPTRAGIQLGWSSWTDLGVGTLATIDFVRARLQESGEL